MYNDRGESPGVTGTHLSHPSNVGTFPNLMTTCTISSSSSLKRLRKDFRSVKADDPGYLDHISSQVVKYRHTKVPLPKPQKYDLRIGGLSDTVYSGNEEELEAWKDFYLPESTEMEVIGTIDNFPSLAVGLQLIILAGEDGKVYAYENEVLHLVAESLNDLFDSGAVFPGIRSYNLGECFEEPTEDELQEMMEDEKIKQIEEKTKEELKSTEAEFLEILDQIERQKKGQDCKALVPYNLCLTHLLMPLLSANDPDKKKVHQRANTRGPFTSCEMVY